MRLSLAFGLSVAALAAAEARLDVPFLAQGNNGCGAAAAAMVMHYWADHQPQPGAFRPSLAEATDQLGVTRTEGVSLARLRRYFEQHAFQAFTLRASAPDLEKHLAKGRPLIVGLRKKPEGPMHYVVVSGLDGRRIWLHDPARRKPGPVDRTRFERMWAHAGHWLLLVAPRGAPSP